MEIFDFLYSIIAGSFGAGVIWQLIRGKLNLLESRLNKVEEGQAIPFVKIDGELRLQTTKLNAIEGALARIEKKVDGDFDRGRSLREAH